MKHISQKTRDRHRVTYRLTFPTEMDSDHVVSWVRSVSGTLRVTNPRMNGLPTLAFEMWATSKGITHRIKVPWQHADYIIAQLRSLVPGIRVTPEDEFPRKLWTKAVEVGLTNNSRQLRIYSSSDAAASILASVQAMEQGEAVVMQWVITPAIPKHLPVYNETPTERVSIKSVLVGANAGRDEINDRRQKLEEPNVMAVLRVGAAAATGARANHLIYRVRAAMSSTRSPATRFYKRVVTTKTLQRRIDTCATPVMFPMQLSAPELASVIAWPIGNPFVSGLPPSLARQLPASDTVPREGRIIGRSNFPGNERMIALSYDNALKHMHVIGPTGSGKTALLANMMRQDIAAGYGVVLIENKGDLFHAALDSVPWERINDVIVLDVTDSKYPVGFNILEQGDPRVVVDELTQLFDHLYKDARGIWTHEVLYHGLTTLTTKAGLTFVDLATLLVPMTTEEIEWADDIIRGIADRDIRNFWQRFQNQPRAAQDRFVQPVMDRIWQLNARSEIRNIIGQSESAFLMSDVVKGNKILLVNLAGLPKDTAALAGTLLMNSLWHAVKNTRGDKSTFLYMDEFQDFINLPVDAEDLLAKARGFGLGMVLAHQHLGQLPSELQKALSANARTKVVFQTTADDARQMSRDFGNSVSDNDFMSLGRYEALARVATGEGISAPLTLATLEPAPAYNFKRELVAQSRKLYGQPIANVEKQITERRKPEKTPRTRRPSVGTEQVWD